MATSQAQLFNLKERVIPSFAIPKINNQPTIVVKRLAISELSANKPTLETALNSIFLGNKEENKLQQAKRILGDVALKISDEELTRYTTEFQYLAESWLDDFEKQIFDNKTLNQVLKEGQNGSTHVR